jgi:mono/diheme cytochrome c family protein
MKLALAIAVMSIVRASDLYQDRVRPLLASRCLACHGQAQAGGLRLDSREGFEKGGKSGRPATELLLEAIRYDEHAKLKMPPGGKLKDEEIAILSDWVKQGAPFNGAATARLWSIQPLTKPALQGIDANVRTLLQAKGIQPNTPADAAILRRRIAFDLTGLPPQTQPGETTEQFVDRLLASPQFGERWARYWLDVARYGEDDYSGTEPKQYANAWRYRDWVIESLNRDMPYDLFLQAQIAGDVLPPQRGFSKDRYLGGLGLFGLGPWYYGISQPPQARADERHDRVDMIGRGMLGLTVACARCHDHKYDPISIQDYYGLAGVFASAAYKEYPLTDAATAAKWDSTQKRVKDLDKTLQNFLNRQTEQLAEVFSRQVSRYLMAAATGNASGGEDSELLKRFTEYLQKPDPQHPYLNEFRDLAARKAPPAELQAAADKVQETVLAVVAEKKAIDEENRENVLRAKFAAANVRQRHIVLPFGYQSFEDFNPGADVPSKSLPRDRYQLWHRFFNMKNVMLRFEGEPLERFLTGEWKKHVESLRAEKKRLEEQNGPQYPFLHGMAEGEPWDLNVHLRGNPEALGEVVPRRFPLMLTEGRPLAFDQGSGRLQLARAVSTHPVAIRTAVNRVWMHLFGSGIVRTPSNLGTAGDTPGNPQLLEYLAWKFRENGFSMKALIREIVLSETYGASSAANAANEKIDGENRYFWRMNRRRLDAEALRDSMLSVAGTLDPAGLGLESKPLPDTARRTIYARVGRFRQDETMSLFDFPSASVTCEQRVSTNVPLQKLYFLNSDMVRKQAEALAARSAQSAGRMYALALGRAPSAREAELARGFLGAAPDASAWTQLAQVLLSSNEFAFID